jgi:small conductance mechanosensitive channel
MNVNGIVQFIQERAAAVGMQILGAIVLYIVGRWLIGLVVSALQRVLTKQKIEPTVLRFAGNTVSVLLNVTLVVAILGYFGVQTTTFAALIAAMGLAIGTAWAGLLANFAAGAFLLVLRPFKVGDFISAGGVTGTVQEIGLFVTTFDTPDNVRTFVGNNKIFSDTIQNFTSNPWRRVELTAQIAGAADPHLAIERLKARMALIANVTATPAPEVHILTFSPFGPVLAVRPYCHNDDYWQVYFDANLAIREVLGDAAFPGPAYPLAMAESARSASA